MDQVFGLIRMNRECFWQRDDTMIFFWLGKTTLLKLLVTELEPTRGQRNGHRNLAIGYFTQHFVDQLPMNINCVEVLQAKYPGKIDHRLRLFSTWIYISLGKTIESYRTELGRFGITGDTALQTVMSLSGGQKCRLAFSLMCMKKYKTMIIFCSKMRFPKFVFSPHILVLDEPTNHLGMFSW